MFQIFSIIVFCMQTVWESGYPKPTDDSNYGKCVKMTDAGFAQDDCSTNLPYVCSEPRNRNISRS